MKNLIIDRKNMGKVKEYNQDGKHGAWVFNLAEGYMIVINFSKIKLFDSLIDLEITTKDF